ncbi:hypothetical protein BJV85_002809 [Clostridium acetobutylicum]|uniref:Uncharacterized protein n=1 Tax=Clostridium acetobutylicum (strain ATCC 824 / DSM 792 / JCM 1419 / IAM 19013 / LMG 5710 / NBRC 13948 / NRRL B-527 / VKM B-1787 / 2291 / W) TaxID=272562 RepID=Q97JT4_CLOAB|nr:MULTISPECIES: hypothetical protein [Clostridium]AAK79161.1 Hypothetical protein CA_C1189 [Clostridium acetobutylicum ATCC 824]ADZ20239.1 Conserved hypothetical protein [Clostridium acetobutylicum EA 2018]AEI31696.1 hypothetical protein SMB_G1209 [Clostridium acetobutylicum DSM 1731]AWV81587.1 hypothetical protein DK921_16105 [Clostridium acetobutylicum]MBC2393227.1 hypothetical protein [Clostridium acetobutylicum]
MIKEHKCKYCGLKGILPSYQKHDRKGNLKWKEKIVLKDEEKTREFRVDKEGNKIPDVYYAHKECEDRAKYERESWCELYEWIKEKWFDVNLPSNMVVRLQDLRNGTSRLGKIIDSKAGYEYNLILECFRNYEEEVEQAIGGKEFNSKNQKANYIMTIIENKIDSFQGKENQQKISEINTNSFEFIKAENIEKQEDNKGDFDFLK